jgi:hypothetical protein
MSHGSAIFQVKDKCTSLVGSRNKLDHSEKKYGPPIWKKIAKFGSCEKNTYTVVRE